MFSILRLRYYYYLYNGHGDVVALTDETGQIINSYSYDEWGNILNKQETISNPIRYAGEYFDEESGLYYLRARYYDPTIGRFISKDSLEGDVTNPLSLNLYTYCINNPINMTDPTGHDPVGMSAWVIANGGSVSWNESTKTATATLNGHTETFNISNQLVINGRIIGDDKNLARAFGVNLSSSNGNAYTGNYNQYSPPSTTNDNTVNYSQYSPPSTTNYNTVTLGSQWHTDYNNNGEKFIHMQGYRFNEKGELVDHNGRVAKSNVTGKAAKVLQYLMNVKPNFFRCEPIIIIVPPDLDDLIYGSDGARVS